MGTTTTRDREARLVPLRTALIEAGYRTRWATELEVGGMLVRWEPQDGPGPAVLIVVDQHGGWNAHVEVGHDTNSAPETIRRLVDRLLPLPDGVVMPAAPVGWSTRIYRVAEGDYTGPNPHGSIVMVELVPGGGTHDKIGDWFTRVEAAFMTQSWERQDDEPGTESGENTEGARWVTFGLEER